MQTDFESACIGLTSLADRLGLSRRTVYRIISRGELPTLKVGRRRLVRLAEVRNWLAGHEVQAPAESLPNVDRRFAVR